MADIETAFKSLDGTALYGTLASNGDPVAGVAVLAHGSGVTREEGGFFTRLASGLADAGVPNLRFDLRAHGASAGTESDLTIASVVNDVRAASDHVRRETGWSGPVTVVSASFSGGACAMLAGHRPQDVAKLVLLNPRLDYRERYTVSQPGWSGDYLDKGKAEELDARGYTEKSPFALGRALLNEVLLWDLPAVLGAVQVPVLMVHGTADTFVPVELSRRFRPLFGAGAELVEIEGCQHGFAVHDDPRYLDPQTQAWQREVIALVSAFVTG
ncbi:alpha/beta fold hydrolase [Kitasatospora sp. GP82]|uniref:alpha/beta hydrolase n=1 Tax=Kitasatospora sp. GP82 TaxID=3035089 RepID=UPI002476A221|nr:alpha/beta fold hydrolase [Kitasatospora sp. GP82]MDH6128836.1 pimeloyl-ACP methyl ester carboxylesterase [Kitasatospora sp. GP82]